MVFSSTIFLFLFLPVTLTGYYLLKNEYRNYWLLILSLIFFSWSQPKYLWIIIISIVINYISAILLRYERIRHIILFLSVSANLALLVYFKYINFIIATINHIFNMDTKLLDVVLPIGISFFTFQGISYVVDVYRGDVDIQYNPLKLALYIAMFPQLIAGPIVRYSDVLNDINNRNFNVDIFVSGIHKFIIGLVKKVIIANTMASIVDSIWGRPLDRLATSVAWLGSVAYTLQIYYDFSGYSDMAIGLGRMFGFNFTENFNHPYVARGITDFWRKWHISLSSWFRDYVYIPMGGNRKHVYLNLFIVFMLTGIWHGASWNFVIAFRNP